MSRHFWRGTRKSASRIFLLGSARDCLAARIGASQRPWYQFRSIIRLGVGLSTNCHLSNDAGLINYRAGPQTAFRSFRLDDMIRGQRTGLGSRCGLHLQRGMANPELLYLTVNVVAMFEPYDGRCVIWKDLWLELDLSIANSAGNSR